MRMPERLHKCKVFMSESQSAVHRCVPLQNCENRRTLDGIEFVETKEYHSYSDNSDATESDEDESTST